MNTQELKQYIDRVLGNNIRCLLPSFWWKKIFDPIINKIEESELKIVNSEIRLDNFEKQYPNIASNTFYLDIDDDTHAIQNRNLLMRIMAGVQLHHDPTLVYLAVPITYPIEESMKDIYVLLSPNYSFSKGGFTFTNIPMGTSGLFDVTFTLEGTWIIDQTSSSSSSGSSYKNVTYSELQDLIGNEDLVPGNYYRITDYITKACGGNIESKELKFDILVQAATNNAIYEDARALRSETGDNLPSRVKPENWKLKYTIDNDYRKYPWAKKRYSGCIVKLTNGSSGEKEYIPHYKIGNNYSGSIIWNGHDYNSIILNMPTTLTQGGAIVGDYIAYKYLPSSNNYRVYRITSVTNTEIVYDNGYGTLQTATWDEASGCYKIESNVAEKATPISEPVVGTDIISIASYSNVSYGRIIEITDNDNTEGTGVIFEMEDEFGNKAPYDFKNLMFKRYKLSGNLMTYSGYKAPDPYIERPSCSIPNWTSGDIFKVDPNDYRFLTTFSINDSQTINDRSLEGYIKNCKLGRECFNNVFIGSLDEGYISVGHKCKYNTIDVSEGYNCIIGNNSCFNITKTGAYGNAYIGDNCSNNILYLKDSKIGDNCGNNYFNLEKSDIGNNCYRNYFWLNSSTVQNNVNNCYINYSYNALFEIGVSDIRVATLNARDYIIRSNNHHITIEGSEPKNFYVNESINEQYNSGGGISTLEIQIPDNNNYKLEIGKNSQGEIKMWNPADLVQ